MKPKPRPAPRLPAALLVLVAAAIAIPARALVDGDAPALWRQHTVQGGANLIGNTVLTSSTDPRINSIRLQPSETIARLSGMAADARLVAAYAFWSGSLRGVQPADNVVDLILPNGATQPSVFAERCRTLGDPDGPFGVSPAYVCRADITTIVAANLAVSATGQPTLNGDFNVVNFDAAPGTPSTESPGACDDPDDPCQAAFGGWAIALVWSSTSATTTRDVILYDAFQRLDEICAGGPGCPAGGSHGIAPAVTLGGFTTLTGEAEVSVFGLEGDRDLGSPPERAENADFLRLCAAGGGNCPAGSELSSTGLGVFPLNFFNSTIFNRTGGTPFNGVDLKTIPLTLPGNGPRTSFRLQAGSGDGTADIGDGRGSNGELFYLGVTMLSVDAVAPNFRNSTKRVDRTTAAPGDLLTYTMHVENSGNWPATARIQDTFPTELEYVAGSTRVDGTVRPDVNGQSPLVAGFSLGQLTPVLNPFVTVTFQARIRTDVAGGLVCNTANLDASYQLFGQPTRTLPTIGLATDPCTTVQRPELRAPTKGVTVRVDGTVVPQDQARPGARLRYRVSIRNAGNQPASNVTFTDELPPFLRNLDVVSIPSGAVDGSSATGGANGSGRVSVTGITVPANFAVDLVFDADLLDSAAFIAAGGADGQHLDNVGVVSATGLADLASDDPNTATVGDPTRVTVRFGVDLGASAKTVSGDVAGFVSPGQTLTYTIRLQNSGQQPATANLADDLPPHVEGCTVVSGPITCVAGGANGTGRVLASNVPVPAGGFRDVSFTVRVRGDAPDGSQVTNVGLVTAAERPGVTWQARSPTVTVRSQVIFVATKSVTDVNGGGVEPGDELLYTLTLRNDGNRASQPVTIRDPLDPNLTFVSADSGGTSTASVISWTPTTTPALTSLAAGAAVTVRFRARIGAAVANGTVISNQGRISSGDGDLATNDPATAAANDPTVVRVVAAPSFVNSTKTVADPNGAPVRPGDQLVYSIVVRNSGRATATNVSVTDALDPSLEFVSADAGGTFAAGTVSWTLPSIAVGASQTVTLTARVRTPLRNGTVIANQAQIRSPDAPGAVPTDDPATAAGDDPTAVTVTSSVTLTGSEKTVTDVDGGDPLPGDLLTWRIRLLAIGDAPARNVVVLDPINRCLTEVAPQNGGQFDGARIRWDSSTTPALTSVAAGTPVDLVFTARIAAGTPDATACANQGSIVSPDLLATTLTDDPSTGAASDPTIVRVVSRPALDKSQKVATVVTDANGDGQPSPGDRVQYTVTVRNTGSETARAVVVTDVLDARLTDVVLGNGGTLAGSTATWSLGDVPARTDRPLTFLATIVKPLDDGAILDNQATVRAANVPLPALTDDPSTAAPNDPTRLVLKSAPIFDVRKTFADVDGGRVEPGDELLYSISVRNTGTSLARQLRLTDVLDPNLTFVSATPAGTFDATTRALTVQAGTLDLTSTLTFALRARIAAGLDNGTAIDNQARVTSTELTQPTLSDDPLTAAPLDPTRVLVISAADLSTSTKTFVDRNGGDLRPGELVDFTITVRNTGNAFGRALLVEDVVDPRFVVENPIPNGGVLGANNTVTWTAGADLAPGATATFGLAARVVLPLPDGTAIPNQASLTVRNLATPFLTDDPTTPALPNDPTFVRVKSAPSLVATKIVEDLNGGELRPGDALRYTLTVRNTGDAEATGAVLTDVLDPNLTFVGGSGAPLFDSTTRTVTWNVPAIGISPADLVLTLDTLLARPLANGTVVANQARLAVTELGAPLLTDDPATPAVQDPTRVTVVARPDLTTSTKTVTDLNGGDVAPEDELEYAITVKNTGDNAASSVVVTDTVDALLTNVTPLDGGAFDATSRALTWRLPAVELSPAGDRTVRFRATVAPLLPNGTVIANQGAVASAETPTPAPTDDPNTAAIDDPVTVTVVSAPQLQTSTKSVEDVDGGLVRPGDLVRYTIVVRNAGNTFATDVAVEDPVDPELTDVTPENGGTLVSGRIRWDKSTTPALARVAPRTDEVTLAFTARLSATARSSITIFNQALVTSAEGVQAPTDDPSTAALGDPTGITPLFPDLNTTVKSVVDANGGDVEPGDALVYTIRLRNDGTLAATDVVVTDPIDTANLVDVAPVDGTLDAGTVTWNAAGVPALASVAGLAEVSLVLNARVKPLTANGIVIGNQASLTAAELALPVLSDADLATPERDSTRVTVVSRPRLEATTLAVEDSNGDEVRPGDRLTYRLTVRNTGNTYATGVVATLPLPFELEEIQLVTPGLLEGRLVRFDATTVPELARVEPGRDVTLVFSGRLRVPLRNATLVSVQGSLAVTELVEPTLTDDPATPIVGDPTVVRVFSAPRFVRSEKSITDLNGGQLEPGDEILYELVVLNDGTEAAGGVVLADVIPPGLTYVPRSLTLNGERVDDSSGSPLAVGLSVRSQRAGSLAGQVIVDDRQAPDDEAAVVQFRAVLSRHLLPGSTISNQGVITSATTGPQVTDDPATPILGDPTIAVVGQAASLGGARLSWKLVDDRAQPRAVNPGDVVEITIEVPNAGNVPVSCVVSTLPLDDRLAPTGELSLDGLALTAEQDTDAGELGPVDGRTTATVRLGEIAPNAAKTVRIRARAADGSRGVVALQARLACEETFDQRTDSDPTLPGEQPAYLAILDGVAADADLTASTKTVEDLNGGEVMPGDVLRYRITIANESASEARDLSVTDVLRPGLELVPASVTGDNGLLVDFATEQGITNITGTLATLAAGSRATLTFLATVSRSLPVGRTLENTASIAADGVPSITVGPATVTVGGIAGTATLTGRVWEDVDESGDFAPEQDHLYAGFAAQLRARAAAPDEPAKVVKAVFTDSRGEYALLNLPPGRYELAFRGPDGTLWETKPVESLGSGETRVVDAELIPSGIVYRSSDATGVAGARAYLVYADSMVGLLPPACDLEQTPITKALDPDLARELPRRVADSCLLDGQQGQHALETGAYRFDLPQDSAPATFRLVIDPRSAALAFPSVAHPASTGTGTGRIGGGRRPVGAAPPWYETVGASDQALMHNHVPVDALESALQLTKSASRGAVRIGEFVTYTISLTNNSAADFDASRPGGGLSLVDALPANLRYVRGSTRALRRAGTTDTCARFTGEGLGAGCAEGAIDPSGVFEGSGRLARFGPYDLRSGETLIVRYMLAVGGAAKPGDYDNVVHAEHGGVRVTRQAKASVRVLFDALFDESTVIGKVFCDDDADGLQSPGELGLGTTRIHADNGFSVEADIDGLFHFVGIRPGLHLFKLDERTLPPGVDPGEGVRRTYYFTPGLDTRLNFPVKCDLPESKPDRVKLVRDAPAPLPPPPPPAPAPPPIVVTGSLDPLELEVDGVHARVPRADVLVSTGDPAAESARNAAVNESGNLLNPLVFRLLAAPGPAPAAWRLTVTDEAGGVLFERRGTGALPARVEWDGLVDGASVLAPGGRYLYRLALDTRAGFRWESAPHAFGVAWYDALLGPAQAPVAPPLVQTLTGPLFGPKNGKPKGALISAVAALVSRLPKGDEKITIVGHVDAADGKKAQALSLSRAVTVRDLLVAQGIATSRIEAFGVGATEPLAVVPKPPKGKRPDRKAIAAAQEQNRRVVITAVLPPPPAPPLPAVPQPLASPSVTVAGQPVATDAAGKFRLEFPRAETPLVSVRVVSPEGTALGTEWKSGPRIAALAEGPLLVQVDLARGAAQAGNGELSLPLLAADLELASGGVVTLGDRGPREPLRFDIAMPAAVTQWQLTIKDGNGSVVKQLDGKELPPPSVVWNGLGPSKAPVLRAGQPYTYQLTASDAAGNRLATARKPILVWAPPTPFSESIAATTLFVKPTAAKTKPRAKQALAEIAKRLVTTEGSILVEGHGDDPARTELTAEWALSVRAMLVELGVPGDRVTSVGRGALSPVVPNVGKKNRERNRRVEIRIAELLPFLPTKPAKTTVKIGGLTAQESAPGQFQATLAGAPGAGIEVLVETTDGREVRYRVDPPPPEPQEERPGQSRRFVPGSWLAQAGDALPPLPDDAFLPPPDDALPPLEEEPLPPAEEETPSAVEAPPADALPPPADALPPPDEALPPPSETPATPGSSTASPAAPAVATPAVPYLPPPRVNPEPERLGDKIIIAMPYDEAPPETVALKLVARLPREGGVLRSTKLLVRGSADPSNEVTLNGEKLALDANGRFARVVALGTGLQTITIEAKDPAGNVSTLERKYTVEPGGLMLMGIADTAAGGYGGELAGIDTLALPLGGVRRMFIGGRVAGTATGDLDGSRVLGGFFSKLHLVANVDSQRRNDDAAFRDLVDPSRFYPVFGDGAVLTQDAPARGPVYFRLDADDSHATFGDFRTTLGQTELFRYDRTLYGADVTFEKEFSPAVTVQAQVIGAPGDARVRHGHVELRATGGSVYYLRGGNVIEGTERVRLVVRDRDTGMELSSAERARYADYFVNYGEGRLLFKQPVSSTAAADFLVNHNLSTALGGHAVFIVVDYEYRDLNGDQGGVVGLHTREKFFGGLLTVGGGFLQENRGSADPYRIGGLELGTRKSDRTFAKLEFARSTGTDANSFVSFDGGLTYAPLAGRCLVPTDPACRTAGNAWKLEAAGELAELLGREGELLNGRAYLQNLDTGFFANGTLVEQGQLKYGAQLRWPVASNQAVTLRHDSVESAIDAELETPGFQRKTVIRRLTGLQYRYTGEGWTAVGEYADAITTDTGLGSTVFTDTVLAGGSYRLLPELNLTLTQEAILRGNEALLRTWGDHLTTTLGAQYQLSDTLTATLTQALRWSGENATQLGLTTKVGDASQLYANQRFTSRSGELQSTTLVGGSSEVVKGVQAYGEYQLDGVLSEQQSRAVIGLNNRWKLRDGLTLSAGYERTQVVGDAQVGAGGVVGGNPGTAQGNVDGVPSTATPGQNPIATIMPGAASRDVGSVGVEYLASDRFKGSARVEGRFDAADPEKARVIVGATDRLQLVFLSTVDWKWTDDISFLTRVVYADSFMRDALNADPVAAARYVLDARYLEAIAGFAIRPKQYDWLAVLARAGRVIDRRPMELGQWDEQQSDVVSVAPSFETPFRLGVAAKVAYKHVRALVSGMPEQNSHNFLGVFRLDYHVLPQLDLTGEYRLLLTQVARPAGVNPDVPVQGDLRHGAVFEVAYRPAQYVRLGAGWNFAGFTDNELQRLDQDTGGFFVRATGQY